MTQYKYNTHIKIKKGCKKCFSGNDKAVYALGLCQYHYQVYTLSKRAEKSRSEDKAGIDSGLWQFYKRAIAKCELRCCECGDRIIPQLGKAHWYIAHLLPKNKFKSVQENDDNWIELCYDCHVKLDRYLDEHDKRYTEMKVYQSVIESIKKLKPLVKEVDKFNSLPLFITAKCR